MALCTKLVQWLSIGGLFIGIWAALLAEVLPVRLTPQLYEVILPVSLQETLNMWLYYYTCTVCTFYLNTTTFFLAILTMVE